MTVAISPDEKRMVTGSLDGTARLWDMATGRQIEPPLAHVNWVSVVAFSPDGQTLLTGSYDRSARLWQVAELSASSATGKPLGKPLPHPDILWSAAFSPAGNTVVTGTTTDYSGAARARLWDVGTGKLLWEALPDKDWVQGVAFSPDGKAILTVSRGREARLLDAATGRPLGPPMLHQDGVTVSAFSPDGRLLLTGSADYSARLWDATTGRPFGPALPHQGEVLAVSFSRDGKMVLTGSGDGRARLWDVATGKPIGPPLSHPLPVTAVAFRPPHPTLSPKWWGRGLGEEDGRTFVTVTGDGDPRVWPVPEPMAGDAERIALQVQVLTAESLENGEIAKLDAADWEERRQRLAGADSGLGAGVLAWSGDPASKGDVAWHERQVRDAEQLGATSAALWHLDRLLAARPDEWQLYARRARARRAAGKLAQADADYARAWEHGPHGQVLDWYRHCIVNCASAEQWDTELWYLNRLLAAAPQDWEAYWDRAAVYAKLGQSEQRDADMAKAVECGADSAVVANWADEQASRGRWEKAAALYAEAIPRGPVTPSTWQKYAWVRLRTGDQAGYRKVCETMLKDMNKEPQNILVVLAVSQATILGPQAVAEYEPVIALTESTVRKVLPHSQDLRHVLLRSLGALLYRAGRTEEAFVRLKEAIAAEKDRSVAQDWLFLALAHHQLGHAAEAAQALQKARTRPSATEAPDIWDNLENELLRREAEAVVTGKTAEPSGTEQTGKNSSNS
jgi:WD40 repeat protein/Flp pilus assembly protein TadD